MKEKQTYKYILYGFIVQSNILFPELLESNQEPEIFIVQSSLLHSNNSQERVSFSIPDVGAFAISENTISVHSVTNDLTLLRLYILGSAFGALIHLRGLLAFHGSAIAFNQQAVLFTGHSGAGKSTMAAAFLNKGYNLISDDVCVISFPDSIPTIKPAYPQLKLWEESFQIFDPEKNKKQVLSCENKYAIAIKEQFCSFALPLKFVFLLNRGEYQTNITALLGAEKFNALAEQTYRPGFISKLNKQADHFQNISSMAALVKVFRVDYPNQLSNLNIVVETISNFLKQT